MTPAFVPYDVAIAGAGITGLTCAVSLRRAGLRTCVLEAGDRVGGCISSVHRDGCIADGGPQTFAASPQFTRLLSALSLDDKLLRARTGTPWFFAHGRLERAPTSPPAFLASPLLSPAAKLRLLAEPLIGARSSDEDESVSSFAARRAGKAVIDAIVRPMINGIFAGDPSMLSMRSAFPALVESERRYTSVFVGAIARRRSARRGPQRTPLAIAGGNERLTAALGAMLGNDVRLGARVTDVVLRGANVELVFKDSTRQGKGDDSASVVARHAVLALPAYESGRLLAQLEPEAAYALCEIPYEPVAQVALSYPRDAIEAELHGFGFLRGDDSGLRILGCAWNSAMFDDRCPRDRTLLTAFLGGSGDREIASLRDDEIVAIAHRDLQRALGVDVPPSVIAGFRWEKAIPQLTLGHGDRLAAIGEGISRLPQMTLVGNYFSGPSISDCISGASIAAEKIIRLLEPSGAKGHIARQSPA
ncbi:MAG TPA: protoporphyrinogen oxidase [Candidatus Eremiobacteraceae bacterium]|nr:protoporphyrinogen oxidase [Candidatus Eremiobacteraceae bacterium]